MQSVLRDDLSVMITVHCMS